MTALMIRAVVVAATATISSAAVAPAATGNGNRGVLTVDPGAEPGSGVVRIVGTTVKRDLPVIDCGYLGGVDCAEELKSGTEVTLRVTAARFWTFTAWGGDCAHAGSDPTCTLIADGDDFVTAFVEPAS